MRKENVYRGMKEHKGFMWQVAVTMALLLMTTPVSVWAQDDNIWETPSAQTTDTQQPPAAVPAETTTQKKSRSTLRFGVGPAWMTSKVYVSRNDFVKNQSGIEVAADVDYIGRKNWGWGINALYNHTSYKGSGSMTLVHLGPCAIYDGKVGQRWRLGGSLGLGLGMCIQDGSSETGLGLNARFTVEYMLSNKVGLNFSLNDNALFLSDNKTIKLEDDEYHGYEHAALLIGLRFHY